MAGNATITLFDGTNSTNYDVWIVSLSTATNNQFTTQQTHSSLWWSPIRRAEMFLQFTCVWPLVGTSSVVNTGFEGIDPHDGFARMNHMQDAIRVHQNQLIGGQTTVPMVVHYWNNNAQSPVFNRMISKPGELNTLVYRGWIRSVEKQFDKAKNVFYTNYYMNILTNPSSDQAVTTTDVYNNITYAPTAYDQDLYGKGWLNTPAMAKQIPNTTF